MAAGAGIRFRIQCVYQEPHQQRPTTIVVSVQLPHHHYQPASIRCARTHTKIMSKHTYTVLNIHIINAYAHIRTRTLSNDNIQSDKPALSAYVIIVSFLFLFVVHIKFKRQENKRHLFVDYRTRRYATRLNSLMISLVSRIWPMAIYASILTNGMPVRVCIPQMIEYTRDLFDLHIRGIKCLCSRLGFRFISWHLARRMKYIRESMQSQYEPTNATSVVVVLAFDWHVWWCSIVILFCEYVVFCMRACICAQER